MGDRETVRWLLLVSRPVTMLAGTSIGAMGQREVEVTRAFRMKLTIIGVHAVTSVWGGSKLGCVCGAGSGKKPKILLWLCK
jgi:hypothetical protein